ncbi:YkgJ family cysteine cluster protein [Elizabethkingia meningoseptica]|nr:YkgJ family cysteine cluster protein [Elizabethkingia meningoseptica]
MDLKYYEEQARLKHKEHKKFLETLKKKPPKNLDYVVQETHDEVFEEIDCLQCANCCKTTGPLFTEKDIERIAKHLRLKPSEFEAKFLRVDEDQDKILQNLPCFFLMDDNKCSIYEVRPKACREYPHTDRKKIYQINHLTLKNTMICPAAYTFVEKIKRNLEKNKLFHNKY